MRTITMETIPFDLNFLFTLLFYWCDCTTKPRISSNMLKKLLREIMSPYIASFCFLVLGGDCISQRQYRVFSFRTTSNLLLSSKFIKFVISRCTFYPWIYSNYSLSNEIKYFQHQLLVLFFLWAEFPNQSPIQRRIVGRFKNKIKL